MPMQLLLRGGLAFALLLWTAVIGAGFFFVVEYENTPGNKAAAPVLWPANSSLTTRPGQVNLVLAVHPHCPCTLATIDELAQLMAQHPGSLAAHVLVVWPRGFANGWDQTEVWRRASAIPGVQVSLDEEGVEARRFGAVTSGQALLFDVEGGLVFGGGLTNARVHAGESIGRLTMLVFLSGAPVRHARTPVYGCALFD